MSLRCRGVFVLKKHINLLSKAHYCCRSKENISLCFTVSGESVWLPSFLFSPLILKINFIYISSCGLCVQYPHYCKETHPYPTPTYTSHTTSLKQSQQTCTNKHTCKRKTKLGKTEAAMTKLMSILIYS